MNTKNILISIFLVLLVLVFLAFLISPPARPQDHAPEDNQSEKSDSSDQKKKEEESVPVSKNARLASYQDNFFVIDDKIKRIDFSNKTLEDADDYRELIATWRKSFFYLEDGNIYKNSSENSIIDKPKAYSFRDDFALFLKDSKPVLYSLKDESSHTLLENLDTQYIQSLDQISLIQGDKYYCVYNEEDNSSACYETYSDQELVNKRGKISDTSIEGAKFLLVTTPSAYSDITQYDLSEKQGFRYPVVVGGQRSFSEPKYLDDHTAWFLTEDDEKLYFNTFDFENKKLKKSPLDKKSMYKQSYQHNNQVIIVFNDRFYLGTTETLEWTKGSFQDMIDLDDGQLLIGDHSIRFIDGQKFKEYSLLARPIHYVYDDEYFVYIYRKGSQYFVSRVRVHF